MRTTLSPNVAAALFVASGLTIIGCKSGPVEPEPPPKETTTTKKTEPTTNAAPVATGAREDGLGSSSGGSKKSADPLDGKWTLADATKDLPGKGPIVAKIETSKGTLQCKLLDEKAPITVANFIGLATGKRAWRDPASGGWVNKPAYDGTTFHRIIKGFMIQGGDAKGNGSGEPGYVIKDEVWDGAKHDKAGLLCMANRGPNTNGAQFFVTDAAAAHLDGGYTIFGECAPEQVVHDIANVEVRGETPATTVTIKTVTISRDQKKK
jgi:peptidyl-prolyl cis-trans isomerase A (cyclophilin A)